MTEEAKKRTKDDVVKEFHRLAARYGSLKYNIEIMEEEGNQLVNQMKSLNYEAAKLKEKEEKDAVEPAAVVENESKN